MKTKPFSAPVAPAATMPSLESIAYETATRYDAGRFAPKTIHDLETLADKWYFSMLLPEAFYPPKNMPYTERFKPGWSKQGVAKAEIIMRYGAALGVLPEIAIRQIYIVEGQPSPSSALMLGLAIAGGHLKRNDYRVVESTSTACKIELFGATRAKPEIVEAKFADYSHLHGKYNWKNYPTDMLFARAVGRAMRRYFPDVFGGVYAAEERIDFGADRKAGLGGGDAAIERILEAVGVAPESEIAPEPVASVEAGDEDAEYASVVLEIEGLLAQFKGRGDKETAAKIEDLGKRLRDPERSRLAAEYKAKLSAEVPSA